jgi:hypothetical protein
MRAAIELTSNFLLGLIFAAFPFYLYYLYGGKHLVPLLILGLLSAILAVILIFASYETFKHRNDRESW